MKEISYRKIAVFIAASIILVIAVTVACFVYYGRSVSRILNGDESDRLKGKHYAFVCEDRQDGFYSAIFEGARKEAEARGDYLEKMGDNLAIEPDRYELMKLATDAGVDGIIVEAGETEAMKELIDRAGDEGIPVITVGSDNTSSSRKSYVGFGYYDLGINYGKEILKRASDEKKRVLVLMSPDAEDSSQNIIFQGIRETIEAADNSSSFSLETMAVPDASAFGAEESISALIMKDDRLPDIMICLNEIYTTCVCQALVDYNRVGQTVVYGFYENSTILSAIRKNIIYATMTMNTSQMGSYCIEALKDYEDAGFTNEFMPADIKVVNSANIYEYMREKEEAGNV